MTLDRHVVSRPLAERMMAAGFPQDTFFAWMVPGHYGKKRAAARPTEERVVRCRDCAATDEAEWSNEWSEICAAPLASEVAEQLSVAIGNGQLTIRKGDREWHAAYILDEKQAAEYSRYTKRELYEQRDSMPDALAALWLALNEEKP